MHSEYNKAHRLGKVLEHILQRLKARHTKNYQKSSIRLANIIVIIGRRFIMACYKKMHSMSQ